MRERISLYGDDAEWFAELKEEVAERRNGNEPSNAEMLRRLLEQTETDDCGGL
jgi:hypothetical protein